MEKIYQIMTVGIGEKAWQAMLALLPEGSYARSVQASGVAQARDALAQNPADIVIINAPLPDGNGEELALELAEGTVGVLLLTTQERCAVTGARLEERGVLVLARPVSGKLLTGALRLLAALSSRLSRMERRNQTLQSKMTDIRRVDRAKWLLIQHHHMSEQDAHYYIEKQAMDTRLSRREIADSIIRTYDK